MNTFTKHFFFLFVTCLMLAAFLGAQEKSPVKEYEVSPGQLSPEAGKRDVLPDSGSTLTPSRTRHEIQETVREVASGYRSLCCVHKSLDDAETCASYMPQMAMIEFLAVKGYTHQEIDGFMVNGGPSDLTEEYGAWLVPWLRTRDIAASEADLRGFFSMPHSQNKKYAGMGWHKGWGELLHESPRSTWFYLILATAALAVVIAFALGLRAISKHGAAQSKANEQAHPAANGDLDTRIQREVAGMGEDD